MVMEDLVGAVMEVVDGMLAGQSQAVIWLSGPAGSSTV